MVLALAACGHRTPPPNAKERTKIIAAVLARQPDLVAQRNAFLTEFPDQRSYFEGVFDIRLCVAQETAGVEGDFDRRDLDRPGHAPNDPRVFSERWANSNQRFAIQDRITLPGHLRWDNMLAVCPSGVLRLGNPVVTGDHARVFVENKCSGWCGWGGEVTLRRTNGRWLVDQEINWWQT